MVKSKLLKSIAAILAISSLGVLNPTSANADWKQSGNDWYYSDDSGRCLKGWNLIDGNWYYMWSNGTIAQHTWIQGKTNWYYLGDGGVMAQSKWVEYKGKWYYLDNNGAMVSNKKIGSYIIGNDGAWIKPRGNFTEQDIHQKHLIRDELGQNQRDIDMSDSLSYTNLTFNNWNSFMNEYNDKMLLEQIPDHIMEGTINLNEAKDICIGKIYNNKYIITDIKFYSEHFKNSDIGTSTKADIAKKCNISKYKSKSTYVYDKYGIFSSSANNSSEWEAMRVVVEFEEV